MKYLYLDQNILTKIKNPKEETYISIRNKIESIKDFIIIPYSTAHLADLKKGYKNEEPYISYVDTDLRFLSELTNDLHWYYSKSENQAKYIRKNTIDAFLPYKENDLLIEEILDFEKMFDDNSIFPEAEISDLKSLGKSLKVLLNSIKIPIDFSEVSDESEIKKLLSDMIPLNQKEISLMELMVHFGKFCDELNHDGTKFKKLRNEFRNLLNLPSNFSSYKENIWEKLDESLLSTILKKSFTDIVKDGNLNSQKEKYSFYDEFTDAYLSLDLVGFNPENLGKKNTYLNLIQDSQHAFFATYCNVFVTNDNNTRAKSKALYEKYQIKTEVLNAEEFLKKLESEIQVINLFTETISGLKINHISLTRVPNIDGSDFDYKIEYIDTIDNKSTFIGTCDLILGYVNFRETVGIGIPHGALRLLSDWIDANRE